MVTKDNGKGNANLIDDIQKRKNKSFIDPYMSLYLTLEVCINSSKIKQKEA